MIEDPDPYLWLMDPDLRGPNTCKDPTDPDPQHCFFLIPSEPFLCSSSWRYLPVRTRAPCRPAACAPNTSSLHHTCIIPQGTVAWEHEGALQTGHLCSQHVIPAPHMYHSSMDSSVRARGRPAGPPPAPPARHPCSRQCYRSGSRIRCLFEPLIRGPE
jgi:hypothetical protein